MKRQPMRNGQSRQAITQVGVGGNAPGHDQGATLGAIGSKRRDRVGATILQNIAGSALEGGTKIVDITI